MFPRIQFITVLHRYRTSHYNNITAQVSALPQQHSSLPCQAYTSPHMTIPLPSPNETAPHVTCTLRISAELHPYDTLLNRASPKPDRTQPNKTFAVPPLDMTLLNLCNTEPFSTQPVHYSTGHNGTQDYLHMT
jgi:hypothetical protein